MGNKRTGVTKGSGSSIVLTFTYQGVPLKERIKTRGKPTSADLEAGRNKRQQIIYAIREGTFDYATTFPNSKNRFKFQLGSTTKFGKFLEQWNEKHIKENDLKDSTVATNTRIVNRINKTLGTKYLLEIDEKTIREFIKSKGAAKKTINNYLSILRPALNEARYQGLINESPLRDMKPIKGKKSKAKTKVDPCSYNEIIKILGNCSGQIQNIFRFAFWTGVRPSELIELRWDDIKDDKIWISRIRTDHSNKPEEPKTAAGYRTLKILPEVKKALDSQKKYTGVVDEHIFFNPNTNEKWGCPQTYAAHWEKNIKSSGVRYRYCYQTRHTFATMMLTAGENLMWVSNQMGHDSTKETLDTYARWIDSNDSEVGMKATEAYKISKNK